MNIPQVFTLKIGGQAGQGIKSSGLLFAKFINYQPQGTQEEYEIEIYQ